MKTRNQGRERKGFSSDPLATFLMYHFRQFAFRRSPSELKRLAIEFSPSGWLIVGNPDLISSLLFAAAYPEKMKLDHKEAEVFLIAVRRSPDFVFDLMAMLRKKLAQCKPHKLDTLYQREHAKLTRKAITGRSDLQQLQKRSDSDKSEASSFVESRLKKNLSAPAPWRLKKKKKAPPKGRTM